MNRECRNCRYFELPLSPDLGGRCADHSTKDVEQRVSADCVCALFADYTRKPLFDRSNMMIEETIMPTAIFHSMIDTMQGLEKRVEKLERKPKNVSKKRPRKTA